MSNHRRLRSLRTRLILASACLLPLILGGAGAMLDRAFVSSQLAAEQEKLRLQVYLLLGEIEFDGTTPTFPGQLSEPLLNQQASGLYAFVLDREGRELWRSPSSLLQRAELVADRDAPSNNDRTPRFRYQADAGKLTLWFPVIWEDAMDTELPITLVVRRSDQQLKATISAYRVHLWRSLGTLAAALILCQLLVLHWGLTPLRKLANDIAAIEQGSKRNLAGTYPAEIVQLTDNLNLLLRNEEQQRQRYHNTLSDLAHSLKTPLAILMGLDEQGALPHGAREPLRNMATIIDYQLQRANRAAHHQIAQAIPISPIIDRLLTSLRKVHRDAPKTVSITGDRSIQFRGDERDLMEILGNLLDNAYKYGRSRIQIDLSAGSHRIVIGIHDDGNGIPQNQREQLMRRGQRGDVSLPGQGIGLAVSSDIVEAYGGQLAICQSTQLSGAHVQLSFSH